MQPHSTEYILQELYTIDPSFRAHEPELKKLIEELMHNEPNIAIDEAFLARLKSTLTQQVDAFVAKPRKPNIVSRIFSLPAYSYGLVGAALVIVLVIAIAQKGMPLYQAKQAAVSVSTLPPRAFGPLSAALAYNDFSTNQLVAPKVDKQPPKTETKTVKQEQVIDKVSDAVDEPSAATGANIGAVAPVVAVVAPPSQPAQLSLPTPPVKAPTTQKMIVNPGGYTYSYTYAYKGDTLLLPDTQVAVYRRIKPANAPTQWSSMLNSFTDGRINLGSFSDLALMNVSLVDNLDKGYIININAVEGSIDMYQNWERWYPTVCTSENCASAQVQPITKADALSDDQAIAVAHDFILQHGIEIGGYGTPFVEKYEPQFRIMNKAASSPVVEPTYYADTVTVVYPLRINNNDVVETGGQKMGLRISIAVREKRVASLYGLTSNNFESSSYDAETDPQKIMSIIEKGGVQGPMYYSGSGGYTKKMTVELGTPTRVLLHTWNYTSSQPTELYVPALSFPVINAQDLPDYYQKNMVVPLAREMLTEDSGTSFPPAMPLIQAR